jgi:hypothetical protein
MPPPQRCLGYGQSPAQSLRLCRRMVTAPIDRYALTLDVPRAITRLNRRCGNVAAKRDRRGLSERTVFCPLFWRRCATPFRGQSTTRRLRGQWRAWRQFPGVRRFCKGTVKDSTSPPAMGRGFRASQTEPNLFCDPLNPRESRGPLELGFAPLPCPRACCPRTSFHSEWVSATKHE